MLESASVSARPWVRRAGVLLIVLGAIGVGVLMYLGPQWARPWHMGGVLAMAGLGLWLLRLSPDAARLRPTPTPRASLLMAGIFFTFGTLGVLMLLVFESPPPSPIGGLAALVVAGLIACGWASAFVFRWWWLIPVVIVFQILAPLRLFRLLQAWGLLDNWWNLSEDARRGLLGLIAVASVVLGYVLMVRFIRHTEREQAHARAELDVARQLHESLVPPIRTATGSAEVLGRSVASTEMGGDLVDVVHADDRTDIVLADVSGHGVGAGIVMAMLKSATRALSRRHRDLPELLAELNAVLSEMVRPGMFATAVVVRLRSDGPVEYALAGHLPILHFVARSGEVRDLPNDALPLAVERQESFRSGQIRPEPGDTLLLFTDGLIEVQNERGRQLGLDAFRARYAELASLPLADAAHALFNAASAHGSQGDDQSLVLIRFRSA
ncbi:serine/threonine-protein phosphatase [Leptolyngbya sp. 15MV]|nr:serine/threonine-protein phosphatase [Leptolyngbya sp. 15MV]